jgi:glutaryl-CoA dehydrogenase
VTEVSTASGTDYYLLDALLTPEELDVRDRVRRFSEQEVVPVINRYWERAEFPFELVPKLAGLGVVGGTIRGHGCPALSHLASGLVTLELNRGDGSVGTFFGVHSGLAMASVSLLGSGEQRARWLPGMARLEKIGAFALTEPDHGSDAVRLETRATRDGGHYVLNGRKRWIGNGTIADLVVVWARDDDGKVSGFVVEKGAQGYRAEVIPNKISKRAVWQADIELTEVRVPIENRLAKAHSFRDTSKVLAVSRYGVAWAAAGHALAAYEAALEYAKGRRQFGRPLAGFQAVQLKLARMLADVTAMQLICLRLAQLRAENRMTDGMASLAKMHNAARARQVAADARDILGGNGVLLDYHVARHMTDLEAVFTYEGTDTIQALIVGRDVTGIRAFT